MFDFFGNHYWRVTRGTKRITFKKKNCLQCGKTFRPKTLKQGFCSAECCKIYRGEHKEEKQKRYKTRRKWEASHNAN